MDGYEFVRALRADAELGATPVIFFTAHYHEREAQQLAEACEVARVLVKPCAAPEILKAVDQVMAGISESGQFHVPENFDQDHLFLVTNKLAAQSNALAATNSRLVALGLLNVELASIRDSRALLQRALSGARNLIGSRYAVLAVRERHSEPGVFHATSGIAVGRGMPAAPPIDAAPLADLLRSRQAWRIDGASAGAAPCTPEFPPGYPPASSYLAVPVDTPAHSYGWICLADKVGADRFSDEDERTLLGLGALVGQIHEEITARVDLEREAELLRRDQGHFRDLAEGSTATLSRVYAVMGGVNSIAVRGMDRQELCSQVCRVLAHPGGYRMAAVDIDEGTAGVWRRIAIEAGAADAALQRLVLPLRRDLQPLVCNDLRIDPSMPLRQELLDHGCRAMAVLPLLRDGTSIGRLVLMADQEGRFDPAELQLLDEVARSVALALTRIAGAGPVAA